MSGSIGTNYLGRTGDGSRIYVTIELELQQPDASTEDVEHNAITSPFWRLSITGSGYSKGRRDSDFGGQIIDDASQVVDLRRSHFTPADVRSLVAIWGEWHLNDMTPGCAHVDPVMEQDRYGRLAPSLDKTPPCPVSGYRYGHAWLVRIIPDDVAAEVRRLMAIPRSVG